LKIREKEEMFQQKGEIALYLISSWKTGLNQAWIPRPTA